jgi:hypothetical protein
VVVEEDVELRQGFAKPTEEEEVLGEGGAAPRLLVCLSPPTPSLYIG